MDYSVLLLFCVTIAILLLGYPVAFSLAGSALLCAGVGFLTGHFDTDFLTALPNRLYGIVNNPTLLAVPLFVFMGVMLEKTRIAEDLLDAISRLLGRTRGGLGIAVILVGTLLAASTGIVGATVVTMGLLSLPTMLKRGYHPSLATGTICATGTLGQIIPPSIVLVLLGDVLGNAYQQAQLAQGIFSPKTISVGDLFIAALIPGFLLVLLYLLYVLIIAWRWPHLAPADSRNKHKHEKKPEHVKPLITVLIPPLFLMVSVLGSILTGIATPTEAAGIGALGATVIGYARGILNRSLLAEVARTSTRLTSMVFMILIGAALFSLVFRGFGGDALISHSLAQLPGGTFSAVFIVMLCIFLLGFILDFIEITFVVVPIVAPALLTLGIDPIWLGIMIAINLQTSFLTPPFGFALFYLRSVAPASVTTKQMYYGVIPYILLQLLVLMLLAIWPVLATGLPSYLASTPS